MQQIYRFIFVFVKNPEEILLDIGDGYCTQKKIQTWAA